MVLSVPLKTFAPTAVPSAGPSGPGVAPAADMATPPTFAYTAVLIAFLTILFTMSPPFLEELEALAVFRMFLFEMLGES